MPLTKVCMWSKHGWERITADKASQLHPGGTVSAKSGLFMCEFCGQYVVLTDGMVRDRYFKHSAGDKSKDCPERVSNILEITTFQANVYDLPIRIKILSSNHFEIELGLLAIPETVLEGRAKYQITIQPINSNVSSFIYSFNRLSNELITYLSIGSKPAPKYHLYVSPEDKVLKTYWPSIISGIEESAIFDKITRKKLPYDADVKVGYTYYLLTKNKLWQRCQYIQQKEVCVVKSQGTCWYIYEVTATAFKEEVAKFFLNYHCRLTELPVCMYPIWPVYVESPYLIYHKEKKISMFFQGDAKPEVFPETVMKQYISGNGHLLSIDCQNRQQLLSIGRTKVLEYTYLWKSLMDFKMKPPIIEVTDLFSNALLDGIQYQLPQKRTMVIQTLYDGIFVVSKGKEVLNRIVLTANKKFVFDDIQYEQKIKIFQGLDCIWLVEYKKQIIIEPIDDIRLLKKLQNYKGKKIVIPHSIGSVAIHMEKYPQVKQWLYKAIRKGYMSEKAFLLFKIHFLVER